MHSHKSHKCALHTSHMCSCTSGAHTHIHSHICLYTYTHAQTCTHTSVHTCLYLLTHVVMYMHALFHTHSAHAGLQFLSDTPVTPLPDGDHVPTVTLDVPAAVGARRVVEGPGWAVDDSTPFCVLLQFPTTGSYWERRLRSSGLSFGWKVGWGDT